MSGKIPMPPSKRTPMPIPPAISGPAHIATILAEMRACHQAFVAWRAIIGPQKNRYHKDPEFPPYGGILSLSRGTGPTQALLQKESEDYTLSGHAAFRLVEARAAAKTAFLAFEQAMLAFPAFQSPVLGLGVFAHRPENKKPRNAPDYVVEPVRLGLCGESPPWSGAEFPDLGLVLALLDGVSVSPYDPEWIIKRARITAPDAETALFIHHAITNPGKRMRSAKSGLIAAARVDTSAAAQDAAGARMLARIAALSGVESAD